MSQSRTPPAPVPGHPATQLAEAGRRLEWTGGAVNPPTYRASTAVFADYASYVRAGAKPFDGFTYATRGTPTTWALCEALDMLEPGAAGTRLMPSGLAAVAVAILACVSQGDDILVTDNVYEPTRALCAGMLASMGVTTRYFDPAIGADIAALMQPNTKAVVVESPGSLTFEVQDVPAIAAAAHAAGALVIIDNTWGASWFFKGLPHGCDLVAHALTKYPCGHADVLMGSVTANEAAFERLSRTAQQLGQCVGGDDASLVLRGLRTMGVRLAQHDASAREIAAWLAQHPLVGRVYHPALPSCPGHDLFLRDFTGAAGLFGFALADARPAAVAAFVDGLAHFRLGYSWGGYESLILPVNPARVRSATPWDEPGVMIRLNIGLEDPRDLIADLEAGLGRYAKAGSQ
jgi:cysteine-S-conjugate beta-lyase